MTIKCQFRFLCQVSKRIWTVVLAMKIICISQNMKERLFSFAKKILSLRVPFAYVVIISFVNFLEIVKQLSTEETQPIPKTSLLHQLKGKFFFINYL